MHFNKGNGYLERNIKGRLNGVHRFVVEEWIGRQLEYNEVVHHWNNNKLDNRLDNLVVMTRSDHAKFHAKGVELIEVICNNCKDGFKKSSAKYRDSIKRKRKMFCSRKCIMLYSNKLRRLRVSQTVATKDS